MADIRIVHLPSDVGGNPQGISREMNRVGLVSETWVHSQSGLSYPVDKVIYGSSRSIFMQQIKTLLSLRYIFQFDVVFYNNGSTLFRRCPSNVDQGGRLKRAFWNLYDGYASIMQWFELSALKLLGKPVLLQYQGSDARQGDRFLQYQHPSEQDRAWLDCYDRYSDHCKRKQISRMARYCTKIYSLNPDLMHVLPPSAEFLPYSHLSLEEWKPHYTQMEQRPLKIAHAPTNRKIKGTDYIFAAVEQLKSEGFDFEFVLIEGVSNQDAMKRYQEVDLLIDQLHVGWYGGLAVEMMALGKPVMAYIREADLKFIPQQMRDEIPVINVTPESIADELKHILRMDRQSLLALARQSRNYVEQWHNPEKVVTRIQRDMDQAIAA